MPGQLHQVDVERWRAAATRFAAFGALGLLICSRLPSTSAHDERLFWVAAAVSIGFAALYHGLRGPRDHWFAPVSIGLTFAFVTALVASLEHTGAFAFFYVLPLLSGASLLSTRNSVALGVLAFALCGAALAIRPDGLDWLMWLNVAVVNLGVTTAVRALRAGRDELFADLARVADTDGLTGVLNRRAFERVAGGVRDRTVHGGQPLAVVLFDIDHFKQINDEHGHAAGDDALRAFAGLLTQQARPTDVVGRVGGEEFAVVLPGASEREAECFAVRVGDALRDSQLGKAARVTVSAGVASHDAAPLETLFQRADAALYGAKAAGRDRVVVEGAIAPA